MSMVKCSFLRIHLKKFRFVVNSGSQHREYQACNGHQQLITVEVMTVACLE